MRHGKPLSAAALILLVLLVSCSHVQIRRPMTFTIPVHPWESLSGKRLWYTFRWTDGETVNALHLNQDERSVTVDVLPGRTVFAAAYPLGEMSPFGAAVSPEDGGKAFLMTQEDGTLVDLLMDLEPAVLGMLNYSLVKSRILEKTDDLRMVDDRALIRDIQNGELTDASFKAVPCHAVGPFALANGIWEGERLRDPSLVSTEGMCGPVNLPAGVFRYLNIEDGMVMVLIVDREGAFYSYLKRLGL